MDRYPTAVVLRLTGLTRRQLDYWDRTGLVRPSGASAKGPGSRRLYVFRDLVRLRTAALLRREGISLQAIRKGLEYLRRHMPEAGDPLASLRLVALRGGRFALIDHKGWTDLAKNPGQLVFMAPIGELAQEVRQRAQALEREEGVAAKRIERNPRIMGGAPVIRGTRIPVDTIVYYTRHGWSSARIIREFRGVTGLDVKAALAYADLHPKRGRPRVAVGG